eukprot:SAG31_NODE_2673_length_5268_cov_2.551944_2_plen_55_part_00
MPKDDANLLQDYGVGLLDCSILHELVDVASANRSGQVHMRVYLFNVIELDSMQA